MMKTTKLRILSNKKGLIGDIISGALDVVKIAFDTFPSSVKFLFFLLLLFMFGGLINSSLNIFGVFCDSANNPVNVGLSANNAVLMGKIPTIENIGSYQLEGEDSLITVFSDEVDTCAVEAEDYNYFIKSNGERINVSDLPDKWFYQGFCTDCEKGTLYEAASDGTIFAKYKNSCLGDVRHKNISDYGAIKRFVCREDRFPCNPPEGYYYDATVNSYFCESETCEGVTKGNYYDELLRERGAKAIYPEGSIGGVDYTNALGISCSEYKPRISVFGIDIFDYKVWLIITLIMVLAWAYERWRN